MAHVINRIFTKSHITKYLWNDILAVSICARPLFIGETSRESIVWPNCCVCFSIHLVVLRVWQAPHSTKYACMLIHRLLVITFSMHYTRWISFFLSINTEKCLWPTRPLTAHTTISSTDFAAILTVYSVEFTCSTGNKKTNISIKSQFWINFLFVWWVKTNTGWHVLRPQTDYEEQRESLSLFWVFRSTDTLGMSAFIMSRQWAAMSQPNDQSIWTYKMGLPDRTSFSVEEEENLSMSHSSQWCAVLWMRLIVIHKA